MQTQAKDDDPKKPKKKLKENIFNRRKGQVPSSGQSQHDASDEDPISCSSPIPGRTAATQRSTPSLGPNHVNKQIAKRTTNRISIKSHKAGPTVTASAAHVVAFAGPTQTATLFMSHDKQTPTCLADDGMDTASGWLAAFS